MQSSKLVIGLIVILASSSIVTFARGEEAEEKAKGRLPAYYKDVIDNEQRDKIYAMQAEYAAKIAPLQEQIKKLVAERDVAIEKILTPVQREKLVKLRDLKRKAPPAAVKTAETQEK